MGKKLDFVKKRDGRIVPFNKQKIADAIFKAAQSLGGQDKYLAEDLAEAVRLYLVKECEKDIPSVEDIQDIVERVLIKTGHAKTAKAYILYREKRARIRKMREGVMPEGLEQIANNRQNFIRDINLSVRGSSDNISLWNKEKIIEALVKETGLSRNISEVIVGEVEEDVLTSKMKQLSSSIIREIVNAKLIAYGFEEERNRHTRLGVPVYDIKQLFEESVYPPDELSLKLGRHIKKEFALLSVIPDKAVEKHLTGDIHIYNLEGIDKFYSLTITLEETLMLNGEITAFVDKLKVFTEHDIVLRLPFDTRQMSKIPESPGLKIEADLEFLEKNVDKPCLLRVDNTTDIMHLSRFYPRLVHMDIARSCSNRAVLNKVTLDCSRIHQEKDFDKNIKDYLCLFSDIMGAQQSFMEKIYQKRYLPEKLKSANKAIEIELANFCYSGQDIILQNLLNQIFDFPADFTLKMAFDKEVFEDIRDFLFLREPFGKDLEVRLYYV